MKIYKISVYALGALALLGLGFALGGLTPVWHVQTAPVVIQEPQQPIPTTLGSTGNKTCAVNSVQVSASTSTQILATSTSRSSVNVVLQSSSSVVYVKRGGSVTTSTGMPLVSQGASWGWTAENDPYFGTVTAISDTGTSTVKVESCTQN